MTAEQIKEIMRMLREIANAQSSLRQELTSKMDSLEKKVDKGFEEVNSRLDMQGGQLNELDDDAPTGEEFRALEKRVSNVERKVTSKFL